MKTIMRLLVAVVWLGSLPLAGAAPLKFDLAGVEFTLPDDGWEIRKVKSARQRINFDNGWIDSRQIDRRLLLRRSDAGKVLAVLLISGGLGEPTSVRFSEKACPKGPADRYYSRRMTLAEDGPPQCVLIGGPFNGPGTLRRMLEKRHLVLAESDPQPSDSVWQVVAFATTVQGALIEVAGVVSADGFDGLLETQPLADSPPRVPPAVAAWADALGAAMQSALDGIGSRKTTIPKMTFAAVAVTH
jgi:hypothetical protein